MLGKKKQFYTHFHFNWKWGRGIDFETNTLSGYGSTVGTALWDQGYWDHLANVIKWNQIYQFQISLKHLMYASSSVAYCYRLVNGISLVLAQRDPIKRPKL